LEEAGTYVQSYTKVQNFDLTTEEIQTIAGGVLQVEVLEKTRSLVADGLRFYTKIKATVTTDKMEELARRIKGKNDAEEYTQLQAEYAKLNQELEDWKQRAAKTPQGRERDAALDHIRKGAQAFARVQQREGEFFQRLVSGKQLVDQARSDKAIVNDLLKTIADSGFIVTVGEVHAAEVSGKTDMLALKLPLKIRVSKTLLDAVSQTVRKLGGTMRSDVNVSLPDDPQNGKHLVRIGADTRNRATVTLVRLGRYRETAEYFQERVMNLTFLLTFNGTTTNGTHAPFRCLLGGPMPDQATLLFRERDDDWFPVRRIFPVSEVWREGGDQITNGKYDNDAACARNIRYGLGGACRPPVLENPQQAKRDIPSRDGYVAIIRDEATFVAQVRLPAELVKNLTGVSVLVLLGDGPEPHCTVEQ
jgi:hypothetical protein